MSILHLTQTGSRACQSRLCSSPAALIFIFLFFSLRLFCVPSLVFALFQFTCQACLYEWCWICLRRWNPDGSCHYPHAELRRLSKLYLSDFTPAGWAQDADIDHVQALCERALTHFSTAQRVHTLQQELDAGPLSSSSSSSSFAAASSSSSSSSAASAAAASSSSSKASRSVVSDLSSLLADLHHPPRSFVSPLLSFLFQCHVLLRSVYIYLCVHHSDFHTALRGSQRSAEVSKVLEVLAQLEYFVDSLDQTLVPLGGIKRLLRTCEQLGDTRQYVRRYASALSAAIKAFQSTRQQRELKREDEAALIDAFFAILNGETIDLRWRTKHGLSKARPTD